MIVRGQFCDCPIEMGVLGFELFEALGQVDPQTYALSLPSVEGLMSNAYLARGLGHRAALCYSNVGLT